MSEYLLPLIRIHVHSHTPTSRYDWLALPHDVEVAPDEAVVRHPHREMWHRMGRHFKQRFHRRYGDWFPEEEEDPDAYQRPPNGTCRVQAIRRVSDWSHGVLTEKSIQNACMWRC